MVHQRKLSIHIVVQIVLFLSVILLSTCSAVIESSESDGRNEKISVLPIKSQNVASPFDFRKTMRAALKNGAYGAIAGGVQVVCLMWLRTIVNFQYRYGGSFHDAFRTLYREGGIRRFYRGLIFALIQNPLVKFGAVVANDLSRTIFIQSSYSSYVSSVVSTSLGAFLLVGWKMLLIPLETVKTVLQVDGKQGFRKLADEVLAGHFWRLYSGTATTLLSSFSSSYPWFVVHNFLEQRIKKASEPFAIMVRSALIGLLAALVSDCISNVVRVMKTLQQTLGTSDGQYLTVAKEIYDRGGIMGFMGRGLSTRIFANGLQSVVFVVVWKFIPHYIQVFRSKKSESKINEEKN